MNLEKLATQGRTKVPRSTAASILSQQLLEMRKESLKTCFENFFSRDHRLETVASIHNVEFIDDSKAENVNATWYSLESFNDPVTWIVAANKDDSGFEKITELIMKKVKSIICVGNDCSVMRDTLSGYVKTFIEASTINDAVLYAFNISRRGDKVLFSPAGLLGNKTYAEAGDEFKRAVNRI